MKSLKKEHLFSYGILRLVLKKCCWLEVDKCEMVMNSDQAHLLVESPLYMNTVILVWVILNYSPELRRFVGLCLM